MMDNTDNKVLRTFDNKMQICVKKHNTGSEKVLMTKVVFISETQQKIAPKVELYWGGGIF